MSVYYNWDLTNRREKDKRHHDLIAASREGLPNWGLHPELAIMVDRRGTSAENAQKGDRQGDTALPPTRTLSSLQR
jgi:hypothetical protein